MKITELAVDRPITTSMIVSIVVVTSVVSLSKLPIDLMPDITLPEISVNVTYPGATPEEIETLIVRPLEEAMGSVENVETMKSTSSEESASDVAKSAAAEAYQSDSCSTCCRHTPRK